MKHAILAQLLAHFQVDGGRINIFQNGVLRITLWTDCWNAARASACSKPLESNLLRSDCRVGLVMWALRSERSVRCPRVLIKSARHASWQRITNFRVGVRNHKVLQRPWQRRVPGGEASGLCWRSPDCGQERPGPWESQERRLQKGFSFSGVLICRPRLCRRSSAEGS